MFASSPARALTLLAAFVAIPAYASPVLVTVTTAALSGTAANIAFDLIRGGNTVTNTVTLSSFATDGTLAASSPSPSGTVSGAFQTPPGTVTLDDTTTFFNEYVQGVTLGTKFSFVFDTTGNAPTDSATPDGFSLILLDSTLTPFPTSDPTGALFLLDIGLSTLPNHIYGSDSLTVTAQLVSNGAPEPGSLALLVAGVVALSARRRFTR